MKTGIMTSKWCRLRQEYNKSEHLLVTGLGVTVMYYSCPTRRKWKKCREYNILVLTGFFYPIECSKQIKKKSEFRRTKVERIWYFLINQKSETKSDKNSNGDWCIWNPFSYTIIQWQISALQEVPGTEGRKRGKTQKYNLLPES